MARATDAGSEKTRKSVRLSDLEYGDTIVIKLIDKFEGSLPFSYPAYKPDYQDEGKFLDGFAQFNMTLEGQSSQAEKNMLAIFQKALENQKTAAAKRKRQYKLDYLESTKPKGQWGVKYEQYGCAAVASGNIVDLQTSKGQKNAIVAARNKAVNGKLECTPFICNLQINIVKKVMGTGDEYKAADVSVVEPQPGCKGLLSPHFVDCIWVHPEDFQKMQTWVQAMHKAKFDFATEPSQPDFRNYPDESGKLYYIATKSIQDPVYLNVFEHGVAPGMVKAIADRETGWLYKPATQHSLLGGYFYPLLDGTRQPVTMEEIKANFVRAEEGKPVVNLAGEEHMLDWIVGSLYQKKFNPLLEDAAGKLVFDDCKPDELVELAHQLGIPVKGDQDPLQIADWSEFLVQTSTESSRKAPVANL
jgi:hypothetical protein